MKKIILWSLFKNTGKIEYYMMYREALKNEGDSTWEEI